MRAIINQYRILAGKPEAKRRFGKHIRRLEDNIKKDLKYIGCERVSVEFNWIRIGSIGGGEHGN
jgi:hypothetical protein